MAVVVAGASAPVSALLGSNCLNSGAPWGSASSSSTTSGRPRIQVGGKGGRSRIGARLVVERSAFLGDSSGDGKSSICELGFGKDNWADGENRRSSRAQCVGGFEGRGRGRVFFMPFGPQGRGTGRGNPARREWERGQRAEQERFREILEREIRARTGEANSSYEFALLRELEKRLRAEEKGSRKNDEDADGKTEQEEAARAEEGTTAGLGASTYELMKELERRLMAERESQRESHRANQESSWERRRAHHENSEERRRAHQESSRERRTGREGRDVRTGDFSSLYDYMRQWEREMREQRAKLEEQWKLRQEERFKHHRRGREDSDRSTAAAAAEAPSKGTENVVEDSVSLGSAKHAQNNDTVVYLKNEANGAEIYLVGTSHVSQKSVDEVREVIERVKPDVVMVELCRQRYENMERNGSQKDNPMAFVDQMVRMLTNGNVGVMGKLVGVGLSSFYRLLSYRGFHPGREFQVAIDEGKKVGAKIVLGDQDIDVTMQQLGKFNLNMSAEATFKFFGQRMPEDIAQAMAGKGASDQEMFERMRDRKVVRRFNEEMEKGAPTIYKALLTERNEVMMKALRNLKGKVVAVVGLAHMDGIEQLWEEANEKYLSGQSEKKEE